MVVLGPITLASRLILGTGKYPSHEVMREAHEASGTDLVTLAVRRVPGLIEGDAGVARSILEFIDKAKFRLLPNTAGCYTKEDALRTARLAREALDTPLVKLEVIGDEKTLMPDVVETLAAAKELVKEGFVVLPYVTDDVVLAKRLEDAGCAAVMPLAAPIGSGLGIRNPVNLLLVKEAVRIPVIVDAGVGTASDAAVAMEIGADAILMNTAIAGARDPVKMARAMRLAVEAGRLAYEAGRIPKKLYATASSPFEGLIQAAPRGAGA